MPFRSTFDDALRIWAGIAGGVFAVVCLLLTVAVVRNRASRRSEPAFTASKNKPLEGAYALLLVAAIAGLATGSYVFNARDADGAGRHADGVDAVRIDVTASRWCWRFDYPATAIAETGECTPANYPTVVVPVGRTVDFALRSTDVVHAFWLPHFAAKRDVYPDHVNHLRLTFDKAGRWRGRCSEFCGTHHVTMDFWVRAVPPEQYQHFLDSGGTLT